jgi:outer membrane protein assembly factor BamA
MHLSHKLHAAACILALLGIASSASSQETAEADISSPLAKVTVTGSQRFSPDVIAAATGLQKGKIVHRADLQSAADLLIQSGEFADVRYRYNTQPEGLLLEFTVADAATLPAYFDNFPWFTNADLVQSLQKAVPLFDGRIPTGGAVLDDVTQALGKLLENIKISGTITHRVLRAPGSDEMVQEFQLDGTDVPVVAVFFTDPLADEDRGVRQSLSLLIGHPFSRYAIETFNFEQVRPLYESSAHLNVKIGEPAARFTADPMQPGRQGVTVLVPVQPGPAFTWGGIAWSGNAAISANDLNTIVGMKEGAPADGVKLGLAWPRVSDAYGQIGYLDVDVKPSLELNDATSRATGKVTIVEGTQYHMGEMVLSGLSIEGEKRIRAGWTIAPGAVFDKTYFDEFVTAGARAAFGTLPFTYAKIGHFLQKDPKTGKVDVMIDFE